MASTGHGGAGCYLLEGYVCGLRVKKDSSKISAEDNVVTMCSADALGDVRMICRATVIESVNLSKFPSRFPSSHFSNLLVYLSNFEFCNFYSWGSRAIDILPMEPELQLVSNIFSWKSHFTSIPLASYLWRFSPNLLKVSSNVVVLPLRNYFCTGFACVLRGFALRRSRIKNHGNTHTSRPPKMYTLIRDSPRYNSTICLFRKATQPRLSDNPRIDYVVLHRLTRVWW